MRRLFIIAALACAAFIAGAAPQLATQAWAQQSGGQARASLSGEWRGVYVQASGQIVEFDATLAERNGRLTGTIVERNTFGDASSFWLLASVEGRVEGATVRFTKTYDGTAGQSHAVEYEGRMIGRRRIVGTWRIGADGGRFDMVR